MPKNYNIGVEAIKKGNKEAFKNAYIEYYDMLFLAGDGVLALLESSG